MDPAELLAMLAEDEHGLLDAPPAPPPPPNPEERLRAAFEEIADFTRTHGRPPAVNPSDIGESKLAMRLKAMSEDDTQRAALEPFDELELLAEPEPPATIEDVVADDPFGLLAGDEILDLRHVPKPQTMPEQIARRRPCADFESFQPLFVECHADLRSGARQLLPFANPRQIQAGRFYVQAGVLLYVAEVGEVTQDDIGKANARTRCIFENGTESNLLLQSLASNLYKGGKRVTASDVEIHEAMGLEAATPMASVYVLRSLSEDPQVKALPDLHKIGCTSTSAEQRTVHALSQTTFLGAGVEVVEEYRVPRGVEHRIESFLHRTLSAARLDVRFEHDGLTTAEAKEWFVVPFRVIDEVVTMVEAGTIVDYEYDLDAEEMRLRP